MTEYQLRRFPHRGLRKAFPGASPEAFDDAQTAFWGAIHPLIGRGLVVRTPKFEGRYDSSDIFSLTEEGRKVAEEELRKFELEIQREFDIAVFLGILDRPLLFKGMLVLDEASGKRHLRLTTGARLHLEEAKLVIERVREDYLRELEKTLGGVVRVDENFAFSKGA